VYVNDFFFVFLSHRGHKSHVFGEDLPANDNYLHLFLKTSKVVKSTCAHDEYNGLAK